MAETSKPCKTDWCPNLCREECDYCGLCGGYAHEMSAEERKELLVMPMPRVDSMKVTRRMK